MFPCLSDCPGFCIASSSACAVSLLLSLYNSSLYPVRLANMRDQEKIVIKVIIISSPICKRLWWRWLEKWSTLCTCLWKCFLRWWWIFWWSVSFCFFLLIEFPQVKVHIQLYSETWNLSNFKGLFQRLKIWSILQSKLLKRIFEGEYIKFWRTFFLLWEFDAQFKQSYWNISLEDCVSNSEGLFCLQYLIKKLKD